MKRVKPLIVSITILGVLVLASSDLKADDAVVEIIDKTNWERAEGLVPDCLLDWVKKGEWTLPLMSEVRFNEVEFNVDYALESRTKNIGKYDLDEKDTIVHAETGEMASRIIGFPFPKIDPDDPKAAVKIMYNKQYVPYISGCKRFTVGITWVGGHGGYERDIEAFFRDAYFEGYPGARDRYKVPEEAERYMIISVRKPYDLAGTSVMMWRYLTNKADVNFAYVPAIRRVRRTSPANRSDGFVGSDFALDDILAYDGKIAAFDFKLVAKKEALVPYASPNTVPLVKAEKPGEWRMGDDRPSMRYGYMDKEWQGAAWAPMNILYARRPVWVIEAKSKDPYYNYGIQYMWIWADTWGPAYKMVHDRSGKFWKFMSVGTAGYLGDEGKLKVLNWLDHVIVDPRRNHASVITIMRPETLMVFFADLDVNDFSLGGFQKYCK